ncbi:MAG: hypothetical protein EXR77_19650 [Myxococcales bacterium]|nr:hypothetical protein [Myxococcales bacterium]
MAIIKRSDGTLVFFHAVPLRDAELNEVTAWGTPTALVVGHDQHAIDAVPFAARLGLKTYGPASNAAKLRKRLDLTGTLAELPPDPVVTFEEMDGTKTGDAVAIVRSQSGTSLLFSDCVQHSPAASMAWPFRLLGFGGGPKVAPLFRLLFMSDRSKLRDHLLRLADVPDLARVIPFHGTIVDVAPAAALRRVAAGL